MGACTVGCMCCLCIVLFLCQCTRDLVSGFSGTGRIALRVGYLLVVGQHVNTDKSLSSWLFSNMLLWFTGVPRRCPAETVHVNPCLVVHT
ncbi:hypothetical protein COO60DRAFT_1541589, partial [Scenedesmus sp. NREL 46B-D3]